MGGARHPGGLGGRTRAVRRRSAHPAVHPRSGGPVHRGRRRLHRRRAGTPSAGHRGRAPARPRPRSLSGHGEHLDHSARPVGRARRRGAADGSRPAPHRHEDRRRARRAARGRRLAGLDLLGDLLRPRRPDHDRRASRSHGGREVTSPRVQGALRRAGAIAVPLAMVVLSACVVVPPVLGSATGGYHATIRRTPYGIPHITAQDWGSLGYGYGYAFAEDNLCELALHVVRTNGEQSRWFGPDQGRLEEDLFYRSVRDAQTVEQLLARPPDAGGISPAVRQLVVGYA